MKLIIHPAVQERLDKTASALPQGMLLTGKSGVGLATIAKYISAGTSQAWVEPKLLTKASTTPQIGIDAIRELYMSLRGKSDTLQHVVIDDAELMTASAQNSFLKLLEEPPQSVRFILTTHHPEQLLPTVRSRVQTLHIPCCTTEQTAALLDSFSELSPAEKQQILFIADGLPAEITRIATDESYRKQTIEVVVTAKKLLEVPASERAVAISSLATDKLSILLLINKMILILQKIPTENHMALIERLLVAMNHIQENGNARLQLAAAMV